MLNTLIVLAAEESAKPQGELPFFFYLLPVLFVLFYLIVMRPEKRRAQQERDNLFKGMKKNDKVLTTAGIYGTVISGDDRDIVVEIAPGVQITMLRRAVMEVVPEDDQGGTPTPEPETAEDNESFDDHTDRSI
jgi:preprotein translocase subunit YajC